MRSRVLITPTLFLSAAIVAPVAVHAASAATPDEIWNQPAKWHASVGVSTSGVINGMVFRKPQWSLDISGRKQDIYFGSTLRTVESHIGTDSEDKFFVGYNQKLKPFTLRWQATYRIFPGTQARYTDNSLLYQVTASREVLGFNASAGAEYTDHDYSEVRKSYGVNASLSRGLLPKLSGWLSVSYRRQWGGVDYTNTNLGLYYQLTDRLGVATSVNNWHAYASWNVDRPTLSVSLSRRL